MIVIGLTGGMGQGKSTVGAKLRELAGVDYKADLEFSFPITEVANQWLSTWPEPLVLNPDQTIEDLANKLIETLPAALDQWTGRSVSTDKLRVASRDESYKLHERLIIYLHEWLALESEERKVQLPLPIVPVNKTLHRSLLQWLGGAMIELVHPNIWADVIDRRIKQLDGRGYSLVTVGGIRYQQDMTMIHNNGGLILRIVRPNTLTSSDVTESAMQHVQADVELQNNGTLQDLELVVGELWQDLQAGKTKKQYTAAS